MVAELAALFQPNPAPAPRAGAGQEEAPHHRFSGNAMNLVIEITPIRLLEQRCLTLYFGLVWNRGIL
jgi:hypothetical protein